jgi:hypothetical protein
VGVGFVLSTLAALAQPDHYLAILLPGMLVGALCGFVTQRDTPAQKCANASRPRLVCLLIAGALSAEPLGSSQPADSGSGLAPLGFLIGRWEGTSEGRPGRGTVEREYTRMLGSRFLHLRNRSVYPPQEANPKGEEHEDVGIMGLMKGNGAGRGRVEAQSVL